MTKIMIKYKDENEKLKIIKALSKEFVIHDRCKNKPSYKSGNYFRYYLDVE